MKTQKNPFLLNLGFLISQPVGSSHQFPFEDEQIEFAEDFSLTAFNGTLTVSRTLQGLLAQGYFEGELIQQCARCLKDYTHLLKWEVTELFVFNNQEKNEDDIPLPDNGDIDIRPILADEAQLNIPINPICKEDCQGLCQICGTDLNLSDCGHKDIPPEDKREDTNSPFSGLKDLL